MSFFKRPAWAASKDKPVRKDFYRRADIFYEKIIASEKEEEEAKKNPGLKKTKNKHDHDDQDDEDDKDDTTESPTDDRRSKSPSQHSKKKRRLSRSKSRSQSPSKPPSSSSSRLRSRSRSQPRSKSGSRSPVTETQTAFTFDPEGEEFDLESILKQTKVANPELTTSRPQSGVIYPPDEEEEEPVENGIGATGAGAFGDADAGAAVAEDSVVISIPSSPEAVAETATAPLDDDEDDLGLESESDEDLKALIRNASRRVRRERSAGSPYGDNATGHSTPSEPDEERILRIYLTSHIPNTIPLLVTCRMGKNLGALRKAWCERNDMSPEMTASVFLTWKDKRVFDSTTCRSLGIKSNEPVPRELYEAEDMDFTPDENTIYAHMLAWTPELWEAHVKKKRRQQEGDFDDDDDDEEESKPEPEPEDTKEIEIRAAGMPTFTMKITAASRVADAIQAFKKARGLAETANLVLLFDGDILQPEDEFQAHDIEDHDMIDARVQ